MVGLRKKHQKQHREQAEQRKAVKTNWKLFHVWSKYWVKSKKMSAARGLCLLQNAL